MADVTVTAADVKPLNGAIIRRYDAGGSMDVGDAVYIAADGDVEQADADGAASSRAIGIATLNASDPDNTSISAGDRVEVTVLGPVAGFSSLDETKQLFASTTAGSIADAAPSGSSGDYVWVIGYPESTTVAFVSPYTYDVTAQ